VAGGDPFVGLGQLEALEGDAAIRAFRGALAELAAAAEALHPVPLEGIRDLTAATRIALDRGFFEDLAWMSASAAATSLYQLAVALPHGEEREVVTKRAFAIARDGDGKTFVAFATSLALSTQEAFDREWMDSRIALCLSLPFGLDTGVDALALALVCRADLADEWLIEPSKGSLASRRLAARLLERAARETARRYEQGDDGALRVLRQRDIRAAWDRLFRDRESLVWRHVASARGLLVRAAPEFAGEIDNDFDPTLTPTEWRRAVVSLAASIAVDPRNAGPKARQGRVTDLFAKDPGLEGAMIFGLPRALESEPEVATPLLNTLIDTKSLSAIDALIEISRDVGLLLIEAASTRASSIVRDQLAGLPPGRDVGHTASLSARMDALAPHWDASSSAAQSIAPAIQRAVNGFVQQGANAAVTFAIEALAACEGALSELGQTPGEAAESLAAVRALVALDAWVLQSSTLAYLLALDPSGATALARLTALRHAIGDEILDQERLSTKTAGAPLTANTRRVVAWLHALDVDDTTGRTMPSVQLLMTRCATEGTGPLTRALCASLSRGCDSLVRSGVLEVSDVVLCAGEAIADPRRLRTLAEASMVPDVAAMLNALADLKEESEKASGNSAGRRRCLDALKRYADAVPTGKSPRLEALRLSLLTTYRALEALAARSSLEQLQRDMGPLRALENSVGRLMRLQAGARLRTLRIAIHEDLADAEAALPLLATSVAALEETSEGSELRAPIQAVADALGVHLASPFTNTILPILRGLSRLPPRQQHDGIVSLPPPPFVTTLPGWVPPNRVLGGFYVLQSLGEGAGGSVFVVTRTDERHRANARRYALKVPVYDGTAARSLTESQFLALFRQEAGALLALPGEHKNIAKFVTFDAGATPKPLLVMELVEGHPLDRFLQRGVPKASVALALLDGIAAGLSAMHELGLGHLDIKPANVILRESKGGVLDPVLVDFGLAGRRVRAGCGTGNYAAPEIWGLLPEGHEPMAAPADVYAFCCLAYELLQGEPLFSGSGDIALIAAHISHDGWPESLLEMAQNVELAPIADALSRGLRQDPRQRASMTVVRDLLRACASMPR